MKNCLMLGGDARQIALKKMLEEAGYGVLDWINGTGSKSDLRDAMAQSDVLICPVPFSKDQKHLFSQADTQGIAMDAFLDGLQTKHIVFGGNIPDAVKLRCRELAIVCHDLMELESVRIRNSIATAEGALAQAIVRSRGNLNGSEALVLGFGCCGKTLANLLQGLHARVTVLDVEPHLLALGESCGHRTLTLADLPETIGRYAYIFNTVPKRILEGTLLQKVHPDVTIIDIASAPFGVDYDFCRQAGINACVCPGLPGKYAPKASAKILFDVIVERIG